MTALASSKVCTVFGVRYSITSCNTPQVTHRGPLVTYHVNVRWKLNPQATVAANQNALSLKAYEYMD
jgi:hypothetical protein